MALFFSHDTSARRDEIRDRKKGPPSTKKGPPSTAPYNFYSLVWREINEAVNNTDIFPRSKLGDLVKKNKPGNLLLFECICIRAARG